MSAQRSLNIESLTHRDGMIDAARHVRAADVGISTKDRNIQEFEDCPAVVLGIEPGIGSWGESNSSSEERRSSPACGSEVNREKRVPNSSSTLEVGDSGT